MSSESTLEDQQEAWTDNIPFLYDIMISQDLQYPSLTVQHFNQQAQSQSTFKDFLLLGTNADSQNFIYSLNIKYPKQKSINDDFQNFYNENKLQKQKCKNLQIDKKINHNSQVNKARINPKNQNLIGSFGTDGIIQISNLQNNEQIKLQGHNNEGYAIQFNKNDILASGDYDGSTIIWDTQKNCQIQNYKVDTQIEDIQFSDDNIFGQAQDNQIIGLYDIRQKSYINQIQGHSGDIYSIDFDKFNKNILISGGQDQSILLWDVRNLKFNFHEIQQHKDEITKVQFSSFQNIMASSDASGIIIIWNLSKIGSEIMNIDTSDGPPEMMFQHSGHKSKVNDFSWSPNQEYMIASVEEDLTLQYWKVQNSIFQD